MSSLTAAFGTLDDAFRSVATRSPGLACLCVPPAPGRDYAPDGLEWSYGELAARVEATAQAYARAGYGAGHRVALLLENRPDFMVHFLALNRLGICVVPVNPDYRQRDLAHLFEHSACELAVVLDHRVADIRAVTESLDPAVPVAGLSELSDIPRARRRSSVSPAGRDGEAVLLFTSGTSGMPKGCMIDNEYLFYAGERYLRAGGLMNVRSECERLYNPLPLFYANSVSISNPAMILSANCMIFPDRFHPKTFWRDLVATRATMIHYLGIIPPVMMRQPQTPDERAHSVRFGIGAGIEPALHAAFEKRFGFPLIEVWGMSEVGIVTAANREPRHIDTRSIGQSLWEAEVALEDEDGVISLSGPCAGELLVRREGPDPRRGFFRGYSREPGATEEAWRGGWFHTGDVVRRDEAGVLHFVDRKKNMIRRSGQNIAAAEVEACLRALPGVAGVAVLAVADELREEEVLACIVPQADAARDEAAARAIFDASLEQLAYFKVPAWLLFVDELPITATQKLRKTDIFTAGEDPRQRPGIHDFRALKQRAVRPA
jgi:crotonobetaine/carnitine-CoA ligase